MKYFIILFLFLVLSSCQPEESKSWTLIPYPNSISVRPGTFSFDHGVSIASSDISLYQTMSFFTEKLNDLGIDVDDTFDQGIVLKLVNNSEIKSEAYELDINKKQIKLTASDPAGIFYGLMTIWQELCLSKGKTIPCGIIKDEPRFAYRGFMLDESRHFFGKKKVMQIIDLMAMFKLNKFHKE